MLHVATDGILDKAKSSLSRSRISEIRQLEIHEYQDRIVIRGRVSSFYHKQLAQELIRLEIGAAAIDNEVRVVS
jgi:hypothetical protein